MASSTTEMNNRKKANGLRSTQQWVIDVRDTELEYDFNVKLQALRDDIAGLSEHYADKLKSINNLEG